jgi:hypothetical protein
MYQLKHNGRLVGMPISHVDDLRWAVDPKHGTSITKLLARVPVGKVEEGEFRVCGKEIIQRDDYSIEVRCEHTTNKLQPIKFKRRNVDAKATEPEIAQLISVVGSLAWISRQARPDLAYRTSLLQSQTHVAKVSTLKIANKTVEMAKKHASVGIIYQSGILDWDNMVVGSIADASHSNEIEIVGDRVEHYRSQSGRLTVLATPSLTDKYVFGYHIIGWSSTIVRRVCRSTMQAETYSMSDKIEESDRFRAGLCDALFDIDPLKWELQCSNKIQNVWLTDCKSLYDALMAPVMSKLADKRLGIELSALRQSIWRLRGRSRGDDDMADFIPPVDQATDIIRWIDTDTMPADAMTKMMDTSALVKFYTTNEWDISQAEESKLKKLAEQLSRKKNPKDKPAKPVTSVVSEAADVLKDTDNTAQHATHTPTAL